MNTCMECLPCLGKNAVDAAKRATGDQELQKRILAASLHFLADNDYSMPPPYSAGKILEIAEKYTGKSELYEEEKRNSNRLAKQLVAELPNIPEFHQGQFESRLRLAAAGNILDFGIYANLDLLQAVTAIKSAFSKPIDLAAVEKLHERMDAAKKILYVLDNCGEAVFDGVFLEAYKEKTTLVVRGRPSLNDVTAEDLEDCGLSGWKFIRNGTTGMPGTILSECSAELRQAFDEADLSIAKGQGNFETMNEYSQPIAFLFLAKCPVVLRLLGAQQNSLQVRLINF